MTARRATRASAPRRSAEEAREEILDAALSFLSRHRFRDLTVARLMERTSIGRSAFYAYFTDLYDLTETLLVRLRDELFEAESPWVGGSDASVDAIHLSLVGTVRVWERRGCVWRALNDAAAQDVRVERAFRRTIVRFEDAVAAAIRREQAAGRIGRLDVEETATALVQLDLAYLLHCFGHSRRRDPAAVVATLERIWKGTLYPHTRSDPRARERRPGRSKR